MHKSCMTWANFNFQEKDNTTQLCQLVKMIVTLQWLGLHFTAHIHSHSRSEVTTHERFETAVASQ